jgi:hypothetical protein
MIELISRRRWTVRTVGFLAMAAALFLAPAAPAQPPSSAKLPKMTYTKNTVFHLPVQMDDKDRANVREVCLYVKSGSADWVRQETGLPSISHFSYKVPRDGEYWFSLVTIDRQGRMTPADVSQEPPGLRVMVDTQAPVIDVQPWTSPEGDFCLRCQVQDANPNPQSLKAAYRDQSGEHVLDAMPGNPTLFRIVGRELLNQPLRITASDLCGNMASREVNVREMVVAALQSNKTAGSKLVPASLEQAPADVVKTEVQKPVFPALPPGHDRTPGPVPANVAMNASVVSQGPNIVLPPPPGAAPVLPSIPPVPVPPASVPNKEIAPGVAPSGVATPGAAPLAAAASKLVLNTTHATIEYRIDQVGPSGVGKVEVYLTGDGGLTWQRLQEDPDRRSPAEIELPGEGTFGIRLVVTNGNGFGGTPPARGDAPTCWIEVDTTVPFVQLRPIDPAQNGVMELRWTASDKNLGSEPVSLHYKTRPDGPWQVIARNVKNDGLYRWAFPRDEGSQVFVKIEVSDLAGNSARAETPNAIILDMTEPHASVVGVTGASATVSHPSRN